jgi:hypothetical protein
LSQSFLPFAHICRAFWQAISQQPRRLSATGNRLRLQKRWIMIAALLILGLLAHFGLPAIVVIEEGPSIRSPRIQVGGCPTKVGFHRGHKNFFRGIKPPTLRRCRRDWVERDATATAGLNWSLNPCCYADRTVRKAFVELVCTGIFVLVSLVGCTAPLSQPEARQATAADPLISPPALLHPSSH